MATSPRIVKIILPTIVLIRLLKIIADWIIKAPCKIPVHRIISLNFTLKSIRGPRRNWGIHKFRHPCFQTGKDWRLAYWIWRSWTTNECAHRSDRRYSFRSSRSIMAILASYRRKLLNNKGIWTQVSTWAKNRRSKWSKIMIIDITKIVKFD